MFYVERESLVDFYKGTGCIAEEYVKVNPHIGSDFDEFLAEDGILEEVTETAVTRVAESNDALDATRYRWLMQNMVSISGGGREGPDHPQLYMDADIWNERSDLTAQKRIEVKIDAKMGAAEEK